MSGSAFHLQLASKQMEKQIISLQREKDILQADHSKTVLTRSRLENLCRELQRQNKSIKVLKLHFLNIYAVRFII